MSKTNSGTYEQAFNLLCNDLIGQGMSRQVFDSLILPNSVIKVESSPGMFQNVVEWETWKAACGTPAERWLAKCHWISSNGEILIMEKTRPPAPSEFPRQVPAYLTDFKRGNFGMVPSTNTKTGRPGPDYFVCHDYGTNLALDHGLLVSKKKVDWA